jgi:hypothetical protein
MICYFQKPISTTEISIDLVWKGGKRFTKQMVLENKTGIAILVCDKVDFQT